MSHRLAIIDVDGILVDTTKRFFRASDEHMLRSSIFDGEEKQG